MAYFVGLDVSVKETAVCVVDEAGKVICEQKVPSEPDDIVTLLTSIGEQYGRVGIEAGPLSQWLVNGIAEAGLPVICVETRHMKSLLKAQQINKSDRHDARGIAQMMRVGLFKPVHVKRLVSQEKRMLLTARKLVQRKMLDVDADLRGTLRNFGLKVGVVGQAGFETRIRELVEGLPRLAAIVEPMLTIRRVMRQEFTRLHKMMLEVVRHDPVCRRLMTAPGVGAVVALTYRATVDQPQRFVHSRAVGAHVGLAPRRHQSGEIDYDGGISKSGDTMLRTMLYEAAQVLLTQSAKWSWLKAWGMRVAQRRGLRRAIVAVARRLAVVLHRMWTDGTDFRWAASPPQRSYDHSPRKALRVLPRQERGPHGDEGGVRSYWRQPCQLARAPKRLIHSAFSYPIMGRSQRRPRREARTPCGTTSCQPAKPDSARAPLVSVLPSLAMPPLGGR